MGKPLKLLILINKGSPATRYIHPVTGQSVVMDNLAYLVIPPRESVVRKLKYFLPATVPELADFLNIEEFSIPHL
jgi:hypothetical protein